MDSACQLHVLDGLAAPSSTHHSFLFEMTKKVQVVINTDQYRGSLAAAAVLRAICAGFAEGRWAAFSSRGN